MRNFIDTLSENTSALKTLGLPVEQWSFLLLHSVVCKIDHKMRTDFELKHSDIELPTFDQFLSFLDEQCKALETVQTSVTEVSTNKPYKQYTNNKPYFHQRACVSNLNAVKCLFCKEAHTIYKCERFGRQTPAQRRDWIKTQNACFNCLRTSHKLNECT